jgi:hypothetical protein
MLEPSSVKQQPNLFALSWALSTSIFNAALMALIALILVAMFYKSIDRSGEGKNIDELWQGLIKVVSNVRFIVLILIVAGFLGHSRTALRDDA